MIKGVLFDFNGTLYQDHAQNREAWEETFNSVKSDDYKHSYKDFENSVYKTSVVLSEVCDRFTMDRLHGTLIVNEINRMSKGKVIPVVIVGCLNECSNKNLPHGVAYNLQGSAKPSWIESRFNHLYVKGGACGMGTLLNASEARRTELYRFLSWLDAREYVEPKSGTIEEGHDLVVARRIPHYPLDGFVSLQKLSVGDVLVVNLGVGE